jgi:probable phosphoglycerate mutase
VDLGKSALHRARYWPNFTLEKLAALYPGQRVVVVTHNGIIKRAAQIVTGAPTEAVFHIDAAPCSITSVSIWPSDGLRALRSLNETVHFRT